MWKRNYNCSSIALKLVEVVWVADVIQSINTMKGLYYSISRELDGGCAEEKGIWTENCKSCQPRLIQ